MSTFTSSGWYSVSVNSEQDLPLSEAKMVWGIPDSTVDSVFKLSNQPLDDGVTPSWTDLGSETLSPYNGYWAHIQPTTWNENFEFIGPDSTTTDQQYGRCVVLSKDGSTLAITSCVLHEIFVYETTDGENWKQKGSTITGNDFLDLVNDNQFDVFAEKVSLNADGTVLAVLDPLKGLAVVYNYDGTNEWVRASDLLYVKDANGNLLRGKYSFDESGSRSGTWYTLKHLQLNDTGDMLVLGNQHDFELTVSEISGAANYKKLGECVDISGDGSVVAVTNDGSSSSNTQSCSIYMEGDSGWELVQTIDPSSDGDINSATQGVTNVTYLVCSWISLTEDGTYLAIGCSNADVYNYADVGMVIVYKLDGGVFVYDSFVTGYSQESDLFGECVCWSRDGKYLVVGATSNSEDGVHGYATVYSYDTASSYLNPIHSKIYHSFTDYNNDAGRFSVSLSISDDGLRVAIGGHLIDDGDDSSLNNGLVEIFENSGTNWVNIGQFVGETDGDALGICNSMSGDGTIVAVAAHSANSDEGYVKIYKSTTSENSTTWTPIGTLNGDNPGDNFGRSIKLAKDGTSIIIGARQADPEDTLASPHPGYVKIYDYIGDSEWIQNGPTITDGESGSDNTYTGHSVSITSSGDKFVVGSYGHDDGKGRVQIYTLGKNSRGTINVLQNNEGTWELLGTPIIGDDIETNIGTSVSINSTGDIIAVGGPYWDEDADGEDASNIGYTKIYKYESYEWSQIGNSIIGEAENDLSGVRVFLNGTGNIVAIGATQNDGGGDNAGHVRVYKCDDTTKGDYAVWTQLGQDIDGGGDEDKLGSVALNDDGYRMVVGTNNADNNFGYVRTYAYSETSDNWYQSYATINGNDYGEFFGLSVTMNNLGTLIAIGAHLHQVNNEDDSIYEGRAVVYKLE